MAPYRPPAEWLQWLDEPPASWAEVPRYVPIGGQLHLTTLSRLTSGCVILEPDGDGNVDDAWIYADEEHVHCLAETQ